MCAYHYLVLGFDHYRRPLRVRLSRTRQPRYHGAIAAQLLCAAADVVVLEAHLFRLGPAVRRTPRAQRPLMNRVTPRGPSDTAVNSAGTSSEANLLVSGLRRTLSVRCPWIHPDGRRPDGHMTDRTGYSHDR